MKLPLMILKHSREELCDSERFRFRRALILYWCFCACVSPSSKGYDFYERNVIHLLDYFSDFEIAEMAAVHEFFNKVNCTAGEEYSVDRSWHRCIFWIIGLTSSIL